MLGRIFTHAGAYNSGAGYVFSRETLRKQKKALGEPIAAHTDYLFEDVGKCLIAQGVLPVTTLDSSGKESLMALPLESHLNTINYNLPW